jgi:hypothetical protein
MQGEIAGCVSDFRRTASEPSTTYEKGLVVVLVRVVVHGFLL